MPRLQVARQTIHAGSALHVLVLDLPTLRAPCRHRLRRRSIWHSLFNNSALHKRIVTTLAKSKSGLTRTELAARASLPSGGSLNRYIDNLEQSGFIEAHFPLGETAEKLKRYRVCDMFTLFHLRWLARKAQLQSWQAIAANQHYKSWSGHAFEVLAWNHAGNIAHALGIARSDYGVTCANIENTEGKAQIDLLGSGLGLHGHLLGIVYR